ncbi:MAG: hypothetical protein K6B18_03650 [Ruminococcus sp.]|nr:hypothetical protein [Ruminococcus sp.]
MKKIIFAAIISVMLTTILASCSDSSMNDDEKVNEAVVTVSNKEESVPEEEKDDIISSETMEEKPVTTAPVEIPDKYTKKHENGTIKIGAKAETTTTTKVTTSYRPFETNQVFPKNGDPKSVNHYDFYEGPFTWEGVSIKFDVPENYNMTLNFNEVPMLFSPDKLKDQAVIADCSISFLPYEMQSNGYDNLDYFTEEFARSKSERSSNIFYSNQLRLGTKNNNEGVNTENAKYEKTDDYVIYTYDYYCNIEDVDTIITLFQMANGTEMIAHVKKGSEYESHYLDDMKAIAKSFSYSDIPYVP